MFNNLTRRQADVTGLGAGNTSTFNVKSGWRQHGLWFRCLSAAGVPLTAAEMIADVNMITIREGGRQDIIFQRTAAEILALWQYHKAQHGVFTPAGILPISFDRPHMPTLQEREVYGLGCRDIGGYQVEITFGGAGGGALAVLAVMESYVEYDEVLQNLGVHLRQIRASKASGAVGMHSIVDLWPKRPRVGVLAAHIAQPGAAVVTRVTVEKNEREVWKELNPQLAAIMLRQAGRTAQEGFFHVPFDLGDDTFSMMDLADANSVKVDITWAVAAPTTFAILLDEVHNYGPAATA